MSSVLEQFIGQKPVVGEHVFLARGSIVYGAVKLGDYASVWFNAVLRGDINRIVVGKYSNVQDNATFHVGSQTAIEVGDYVTVGHNAIVHGCKVSDGCMIGMGSILLDHSFIPEGCLVGAGAVVTPKLKATPHSLIVGSPAKVVRELSQQEVDDLRKWAMEYAEVAQYHLQHQIGVSTDTLIQQVQPK